MANENAAADNGGGVGNHTYSRAAR